MQKPIFNQRWHYRRTSFVPSPSVSCLNLIFYGENYFKTLAISTKHIIKYKNNKYNLFEHRESRSPISVNFTFVFSKSAHIIFSSPFSKESLFMVESNINNQTLIAAPLDKWTPLMPFITTNNGNNTDIFLHAQLSFSVTPSDLHTAPSALLKTMWNFSLERSPTVSRGLQPRNASPKMHVSGMCLHIRLCLMRLCHVLLFLSCG